MRGMPSTDRYVALAKTATIPAVAIMAPVLDTIGRPRMVLLQVGHVIPHRGDLGRREHFLVYSEVPHLCWRKSDDLRGCECDNLGRLESLNLS